MNRLSKQRQAQVVAALVEGNSLRSTVRMTGVALHTVLKLLADLGTACAAYHDAKVRNLRVRHLGKKRLRVVRLLPVEVLLQCLPGV